MWSIRGLFSYAFYWLNNGKGADKTGAFAMAYPPKTESPLNYQEA